MLQAILLSTAGFFVIWVLVDDLLPGETKEGERKKGGSGGLFTLVTLPLLLLFMLLRFAGEAAVLLARLLVPFLAVLFSLLRHVLKAVGSLLRKVSRFLLQLLHAARSFFTRTLGFLFRFLLRGLCRNMLRFLRKLFLRPLRRLFYAASSFLLSILRNALTSFLRHAGAFLQGLLRSLGQLVLSVFHGTGMLFRKAGTLWRLLHGGRRGLVRPFRGWLRPPLTPLLLPGSFVLFILHFRPWNRRKRDARDEEAQENDSLSWERMRSIGWHTRTRLHQARTA